MTIIILKDLLRILFYPSHYRDTTLYPNFADCLSPIAIFGLQQLFGINDQFASAISRAQEYAKTSV